MKRGWAGSLIGTTGALALAFFGCEEPTEPRAADAVGSGDRSDIVAAPEDESVTAEDALTIEEEPYTLTRVCTFNIEDLRYDDIMAAGRGDDNEGANRARYAARLIAAIDPDILLVNELEYDFISAEPLSGEAFAQLIRQQRAHLGLGDREYQVFQEPSNTGIHSGLDLNRDGQVVFEPGSREYGNDALGYGEFPGHYAMGLFVASPLEIERDEARTFQSLLWQSMPDALLPAGDGELVPESELWYTDEMLAKLPLSSKSHWDIPVRLEDGSVLRVLASHPTPPVFDGPEDRNGRRNHDEIRFWAEYLRGAKWIVDDSGVSGGASDDPAVIMGDLNSDPIAGDSLDNPVSMWLLANPLLDGSFTPQSELELEFRGRVLRPDATAEFGLRVDYVLPTRGSIVVRGGIVRGEADLPSASSLSHESLDSLVYDVSDHFPVWLDLRLPDPEQ